MINIIFSFVKNLIMLKVDEKLLDSVFDSIYSKLEIGNVYSTSYSKKFMFNNESIYDANIFSIKVDIPSERNLIYIFEILHSDSNNIINRIIRFLKMDTYYLKVTIKENGWVQNTYFFESNRHNYYMFKDLYDKLLMSKPNSDKAKYEDDISKWASKLDTVISKSIKRDKKLNSLINK